MARLFTSTLLIVSLILIAACSRGDPRLLNLRNNEDGPDEFSVLPTEPLEIPEDIAELPLPQPTLGGVNRVDPDPEAQAIAALGGNIERAQSAAGDIVSYSSRFGVSQDIREVLAAEDLEFRRRNNGRVLERAFGVNVYFRAYRRMSLDRYAELDRLRRSGVRTPAAPPQELDQ